MIRNGSGMVVMAFSHMQGLRVGVGVGVNILFRACTFLSEDQLTYTSSTLEAMISPQWHSQQAEMTGDGCSLMSCM